MKSAICLAIAILFSSTLLAQSASQPLGLISELSHLKYESEMTLVQGIHRKDSTVTVQNYYKVFTLVNSMILQLEADIKSSNCLRTYKKLDKLLKKSHINDCNSKDFVVQSYVTTLRQASNVWNKNEKSFTGIVSGVSSVADILETFVGIHKTIENVKSTKVGGICDLLDAVKLAGYSEILKRK
jgi:hypothetical protein